MTTMVSADLSVVEFAYLVRRSTSIVLPRRLNFPWQPDLLTAGDRGLVERGLVDGLIAKGLLVGVAANDAVTADDLSDYVPHAWRSFLAVFALSPLTITCNAWTEKHSSTLNVALATGYAVSLLSGATLRAGALEREPESEAEQRLRLTAMEVDSVAGMMLDIFPGATDDDRRSLASAGITLSLADAQAGILALREGRFEVVEALVRQWGEPQFPRVFGGLALDATGGFEITVHTVGGESVFRASWVRGDRGWLNVRINGPSDGSRTAESFVEDATVTVTPACHATVTAEVLGLITAITTGGPRGNGA